MAGPRNGVSGVSSGWPGPRKINFRVLRHVDLWHLCKERKLDDTGPRQVLVERLERFQKRDGEARIPVPTAPSAFNAQVFQRRRSSQGQALEAPSPARAEGAISESGVAPSTLAAPSSEPGADISETPFSPDMGAGDQTPLLRFADSYKQLAFSEKQVDRTPLLRFPDSEKQADSERAISTPLLPGSEAPTPALPSESALSKNMGLRESWKALTALKPSIETSSQGSAKTNVPKIVKPEGAQIAVEQDESCIELFGELTPAAPNVEDSLSGLVTPMLYPAPCGMVTPMLYSGPDQAQADFPSPDHEEDPTTPALFPEGSSPEPGGSGESDPAATLVDNDTPMPGAEGEPMEPQQASSWEAPVEEIPLLAPTAPSVISPLPSNMLTTEELVLRDLLRNSVCSDVRRPGEAALPISYNDFIEVSHGVLPAPQVHQTLSSALPSPSWLPHGAVLPPGLPPPLPPPPAIGSLVGKGILGMAVPAPKLPRAVTAVKSAPPVSVKSASLILPIAVSTECPRPPPPPPLPVADPTGFAAPTLPTSDPSGFAPPSSLAADPSGFAPPPLPVPDPAGFSVPTGPPAPVAEQLQDPHLAAASELARARIAMGVSMSTQAKNVPVPTRPSNGASSSTSHKKVESAVLLKRAKEEVVDEPSPKRPAIEVAAVDSILARRQRAPEAPQDLVARLAAGVPAQKNKTPLKPSADMDVSEDPATIERRNKLKRSSAVELQTNLELESLRCKREALIQRLQGRRDMREAKHQEETRNEAKILRLREQIEARRQHQLESGEGLLEAWIKSEEYACERSSSQKSDIERIS